MIAYEELVSALAVWRERNGLAVGAADYLGAPPPPVPVEFVSAVDDGDGALEVDGADIYADEDIAVADETIDFSEFPIEGADDAIIDEAIIDEAPAYPLDDSTAPQDFDDSGDGADEVAFIASAVPNDAPPPPADEADEPVPLYEEYPAIEATTKGIAPAPPGPNDTGDSLDVDASDYPPTADDDGSNTPA